MTSDQNEAVAHRWHLEMCQEGKTDLANQILTPDVIIHGNGQEFNWPSRRHQAHAPNSQVLGR